MPDALGAALERFVGGDLRGAHLPCSPNLSDGHGRWMVAGAPSRLLAEPYASREFTRARRFLALPSQTRVRWLLPLENNRTTLAGLDIYTPYAPGARALKTIFKLALKTGWLNRANQCVLVTSKGTLPLEVLVAEITGERNPVFALSLGTPTRYRKLSVQVMRSDGKILGYLKLPLTQPAAGRIRHEAETLRRLSEFENLRPRIPKVLYAGDWDDGYILFQSPAPSIPGPIQFNGLYTEFLNLLWKTHPTEKLGSFVVSDVAARWEKTEGRLDCKWRALGEAALNWASKELSGIMIPCGVSHGDFAPWNARVANGQLSVFDWESASWDAPAAWDIFHFKTQVAALLNKKNDLHISRNGRSGDRASFLLYLLNSACHLLDEESPSRNIGLEFRRKQIAKQLEWG